VLAELAVGEIVAMAKQKLQISNPDHLMTDDEIRAVCKLIASMAPDHNDRPEGAQFSRLGIGTMLFVALGAFPRFYERYELSQIN
jgi:hypothetical protein